MNTARQDQITHDLNTVIMALQRHPDTDHLQTRLMEIRSNVIAAFQHNEMLQSVMHTNLAPEVAPSNPTPQPRCESPQSQASRDFPQILREAVQGVLKEVPISNGFREKLTDSLVEEFRKRATAGYGSRNNASSDLKDDAVNQTLMKEALEGVSQLADAAHEENQKRESLTRKAILDKMEKLMMSAGSDRLKEALFPSRYLTNLVESALDKQVLENALKKGQQFTATVVADEIYKNLLWVTTLPLGIQGRKALDAWKKAPQGALGSLAAKFQSDTFDQAVIDELVKMRREDLRLKRESEQPLAPGVRDMLAMQMREIFKAPYVKEGQEEKAKETPTRRYGGRLGDSPTALQAGTFALITLLMKDVDITGEVVHLLSRSNLQQTVRQFLKGEIHFKGKDFPKSGMGADDPVTISLVQRRKIVDNFVQIFSQPFESDYRIRRKYNKDVDAMLSELTKDKRKIDYLVSVFAMVAVDIRLPRDTQSFFDDFQQMKGAFAPRRPY